MHVEVCDAMKNLWTKRTLDFANSDSRGRPIIEPIIALLSHWACWIYGLKDKTY